QLGLGAQSETVGERGIRRIALAFIYIRCGVYYVFYVRPYVHVFSCGNVCGCCLCMFYFFFESSWWPAGVESSTSPVGVGVGSSL
ncbi:unnamed protein product, partial [Laminaria digitata]